MHLATQITRALLQFLDHFLSRTRRMKWFKYSMMPISLSLHHSFHQGFEISFRFKHFKDYLL